MAERKSILLRLPPELWEELNRWARHDLRSLNAQIEYLLREAAWRHRRRGNDPAGRIPADAASDEGSSTPEA